jgi:adenosylcobinamide kinase / adenosylcobinamide-phosphate guanylyltransferase
MSLIFLVGGARSGKSALAVRAAAATGAAVVFVATAEALDDEMGERIAAHRAERPREWQTVEAPVELAAAIDSIDPQATVIVDCLSLWVANLLEADVAVEDAAVAAAHVAAARPGRTIAVSNEVGLGLVPMNALGRRYRDLLGRINAIWATSAERAFLIVAGRAVPLMPTEDLLDG